MVTKSVSFRASADVLAVGRLTDAYFVSSVAAVAGFDLGICDLVEQRRWVEDRLRLRSAAVLVAICAVLVGELCGATRSSPGQDSSSAPTECPPW